MSAVWFDTHCHIGPEKKEEAAGLVEAAHGAGVKYIMVPGTDVEDCGYAAELTRFPGVFASVGVHPHGADARYDMEYFRGLFSVPGVKAVGEIGLDYYYDTSSRENQRRVFGEFLELAVELKVPAVIHCREAFCDAISIVRDRLPPGHPFEIHSFTGTEDECGQWLELGAMISCNGMVTFNKADNIRTALKMIPVERLLLETDSPYLAPVPLRGRENKPENIPIIGAGAAKVLGLEPEYIAEVTTGNGLRFFGIEEQQ